MFSTVGGLSEHGGEDDACGEEDSEVLYGNEWESWPASRVIVTNAMGKKCEIYDGFMRIGVMLVIILAYRLGRSGVAQEGDGLARGDAVPRPAGWGRSGVAAMRAEHESEVTALKEEKLDMVMKYQASAARVREEEQRCAELTDSVEDLQMQVTKLQVSSRTHR